MNKLIIAWLLATVACLSARAEYTDHRNRRVDSLEMVLQKNASLTDTERIGIYKDLMWGYLQTDRKRSVDYAQKTLALSYKIKGLNVRVNALRILGLNAYGGGDYKTALKYLEEALAVTDSMKNDRRYTEADIDDNLSALYGTIANVYNMQDQLHLAIAYYQKALPIFEKHGWMESTSVCHHNIGELYLSMGNNKEAEHHYPDCKIDLTVEESPVIGLVRDAEEFESKCHLDESEHYLDAVQPAAALHLLEEGREHCQDGEGEGEGHAESQHGDHRSPEFT